MRTPRKRTSVRFTGRNGQTATEEPSVFATSLGGLVSHRSVVLILEDHGRGGCRAHVEWWHGDGEEPGCLKGQITAKLFDEIMFAVATVQIELSASVEAVAQGAPFAD
jgi:hypothetical protein